MTQKEMDRLNELRAKDLLDEKEFAQLEFLERKVVTDERVKQFRKNQQAPYSKIGLIDVDSHNYNIEKLNHTCKDQCTNGKTQICQSTQEAGAFRLYQV